MKFINTSSSLEIDLWYCFHQFKKLIDNFLHCLPLCVWRLNASACYTQNCNVGERVFSKVLSTLKEPHSHPHIFFLQRVGVFHPRWVYIYHRVCFCVSVHTCARLHAHTVFTRGQSYISWWVESCCYLLWTLHKQLDSLLTEPVWELVSHQHFARANWDPAAHLLSGSGADQRPTDL